MKEAVGLPFQPLDEHLDISSLETWLKILPIYKILG